MKTFRDTRPMTREASNAPQACPPCAGSCNQGRACPAQQASKLDRALAIAWIEGITIVAILAVVAVVHAAWRLIAW